MIPVAPRTLLLPPRMRVHMVAAAIGILFVLLLIRTAAILIANDAPERNTRSGPAVRRADIVDRHGDILATSLITWSLYANPRQIFDAADLINALQRVLPEINRTRLTGRLNDRSKAFVWIRRGLTPRQRRRVFDLGLEGLDFRREYGRVYPAGALARHVLGAVDRDGRGIAGLELTHESDLRTGNTPLRLTLDASVQSSLEDEIEATARTTGAAGVGGVVIESASGAILALASWPAGKTASGHLNRITGAVYELGSVFKPITAAAGLAADVISETDTLDVSKPLFIAGKQLSSAGHGLPDPKAATLQDIIVHSSNIGIVRAAERLGPERLREFFQRIGILDRPDIDFPGVASPLTPQRWDHLTNQTASFGHGIAVSPLSLATAYAVIANGGRNVRPHLAARSAFAESARTAIMPEVDADSVLAMLRAVVTDGTGKRARAPGYAVAGKTGTAEKPGPGGYRKDANVCTFVAVFPYPSAKYVALIVIDEPKGKARNASATAAPAMARLIGRIAPLLGVRPVRQTERASVVLGGEL